MHARDLGWAVLCAGLATSTTGWAQSAPTQVTLAESLFDEGQALMSMGRYEEACPKLAESHRLDPAGGTLLNLAVCHEQQGLIGSAWAEFRDALARATLDRRPDREQLARDHLKRLESTVPRLILRVAPDAAVDGLRVWVDGVGVGPAAWGSEFPLDPGSHTILAAAPGRSNFEHTLSLAPSERREVAITLTGETPGADRAAGRPRVPSPSDPGAGQRTTGFVFGAVGLAAVGVGSWFGIQAVLDRKNSDAKCNPLCTDEAERLNDDAKKNARIADVGIGVGLVAVAAGAYLVLTAPAPTTPSPAARWRWAPVVGDSQMGLRIDATW